MTIVDTGPLVAILNPDDEYHARCVTVLPALRLPFVTTASVVTEAMHFLYRRRGWIGQQTLWRMIEVDKLRVSAVEGYALDRIEQLMDRYQDSPMDFADASLVTLAEEMNLRQVFTLDSHFRAYRMSNRRVLDIVPDPE
jgi:uncharacterized protein